MTRALGAFDRSFAPARVARSKRARGRVTRAMAAFHDLRAPALDGSTIEFASMKGKVVLVTNVASR
jgi:hypothetical protein